MKKDFLFFFLFTGVCFLIYSGLFNTFYQQDEWMPLGHVIASGANALFPESSVLEVLFGQGRILALEIYFIFFHFFPFQIAPFVWFALVFQILNTWLLFLITRKVSKNTFVSLIAGFFFLASSVSNQAITWVGSSINTLFSSFLVLLSIYFYIYFLETNKKNFFFMSFLSFVLTIYFKESGVFLFLFFSVLHFLYKQKTKIKDAVKNFTPFILFGFLLVASRLFFLVLSPNKTVGFVNSGASLWAKLLLHIVLYPVESISQIFIYPTIMWDLTDQFIEMHYSRIWGTSFEPIVRESVGGDLLSFMLAFVIIFVLLIIFIVLKNLRKTLYFALSFFLLSFLPYIFIDKTNAYLEPRYYYLGAGGAGILLGAVSLALKTGLEKIKINKIISILLVSAGVFLFLLHNTSLIRDEIYRQGQYAKERKQFLKSIKLLHPRIGPNSVFYVTGNKDFYIANHKVPFQQGLGFTLMVWYYDSEKIPGGLVIDNFLWDIQSQGFEHKDDSGFGYFWDYNTLKNTIKEKKLSKKSIIGLYYDGDKQELIDITDDLFKKL